MFNVLRKLVPRPFKSLYHYCMGFFGALVYGFPSKELVVIGVTGTSGKSTTVYFLTRLLEHMGEKVASLSTIEFCLPSGRVLNNKKMTMVGRFFIQKFLRQAVREGCRYAIVETTSEGVVQFRHKFIQYDVGVLTNLYPEHIESHGGFENYKAAKMAFFAHVAARPSKVVNGHAIPTVLVVNGSNEHSQDFLQPFQVDHTVAFGVKGAPWEVQNVDTIIRASNVASTPQGVAFELFGTKLQTTLLGNHNIDNILASVAVLAGLGFPREVTQEAIEHMSQPPGRLERIHEGQPFTVIVDYAFEPVAVRALYDTVQGIPHRTITHVFGATGGGRDTSRRAVLGEFAGKNAHKIILTNEDPYDEDPESIMNQVAEGVERAGKVFNRDAWKIIDRKEAIEKALTEAGPGDIVLITGKGSEQAMVVKGGKKIPWDDRSVVRELLKKFG